MYKISKEDFDKLNSLIGRLATYNNRVYKILSWQITKGELLLLGRCKRFETSLNYFTPYVFEEQRFFTLGDLI